MIRKAIFVGLFSFLFGSDDSISNSEPSVNIDGSPMCGSVDINGNPYGVTSTVMVSIFTRVLIIIFLVRIPLTVLTALMIQVVAGLMIGKFT